MGVGESAVAFARLCIESEVRGTAAPVPPEHGFGDPRGVFVTVNEFPSGDLRGCIGYPYPVMSLGDAVDSSARSACHDPRFPDLSVRELDHVTVEVTILTVPEEIDHDDPRSLPGMVHIGEDGLIIEFKGRRGLLLPQVPVEWGWDAETFLRHLSMKAGLPPDAWTWDGARIWSFGGEVFSETSPRGEIVRRDI
ncbi:MAG: TIGR00296 family protein [Candidatus Methanomethylophilaceae archaeon]